MDFGDLSGDTVIQDQLTKFRNSICKIEDMLNNMLSIDIYDKLTTKEKVDYDLFMVYTLNTLYWLYLRTKNEDPNKHDIKNQLDRVKTYMVRAKQAYERQTIRPTIDKPAAERFVKHGIQYKRNKNNDLPLNQKNNPDCK